MIHLRLSGGLGNQLFLFAYALRLADYNPLKIRVYAGDLSNYSVARTFELDRILDVPFFPCNFACTLLLRSRIPRLFDYPLFFNDKNYLSVGKGSNVNTGFVDGYFQFDQPWSFIERSIAFFIETNILRKPTVRSGLVVHARGGDFLHDRQSHSHQLEFYRSVLDRYPSLPNKGRICCSDPYYASEIIRFFDDYGVNLSYTHSTDTSWLDDFNALSSASMVLGSRSTFAWWATALHEIPSFFPHDFNIGVGRNLYHPAEMYV